MFILYLELADLLGAPLVVRSLFHVMSSILRVPRGARRTRRYQLYTALLRKALHPRELFPSE